MFTEVSEVVEVVRSEAELKAAEVLLELSWNPRVFSQVAPPPIPEKNFDTREPIAEVSVEVPAEEAAKNSSPGPASVRGPQTFQFKVIAGGSQYNSTSIVPTKRQAIKKPVGPRKWKLNLYKKYQQEQRRWKAECLRRKAAQKRFNDFILQTEHEKNQAIMDEEKDLLIEIKFITERIAEETDNSLEGEVAAEPSEDAKISEGIELANTTTDNTTPPKRMRTRRAENSCSSCCTSSITPPSPKQKNFGNKKCKVESSSYEENEKGDEDGEEEQAPLPATTSQSRNVRKINVKTEMVPIGKGHAQVPSRLLKQINWSSYTSATRKLLSAVFGRKVLATHSLSGKPSPAFPNKPAKQRLDADIVEDIVITVRKNCIKVSEKHIRAIITTKCADESKMLRSQRNNENRHKTT